MLTKRAVVPAGCGQGSARAGGRAAEAEAGQGAGGPGRQGGGAVGPRRVAEPPQARDQEGRGHCQGRQVSNSLRSTLSGGNLRVGWFSCWSDLETGGARSAPPPPPPPPKDTRREELLRHCKELTDLTQRAILADILSVPTQTVASGFQSRTTVGMMLNGNIVDNILVGGPVRPPSCSVVASSR